MFTARSIGPVAVLGARAADHYRRFARGAFVAEFPDTPNANQQGPGVHRRNWHRIRGGNDCAQVVRELRGPSGYENVDCGIPFSNLDDSGGFFCDTPVRCTEDSLNCPCRSHGVGPDRSSCVPGA